jgi:hypothetical protein
MSEVTSVNGMTGAVVLTAADVEAVATSAEGQPGGVATLDGSGVLEGAQLPSSVVSSSAASGGYTPVANGTGGYTWLPPGGTILLDALPGIDPTGTTDSSTALLSAVAAALGSGPGGTNRTIIGAVGSTYLTSQPIPHYSGFRMFGDALGSGTLALHPNCTIKNITSDIFCPPASASSGIVEDIRIEGFHFQGSGPNQNTNIITPQPTDGTGWVYNDLYFNHNSWDYFQHALCGTFLRLHLRDFNGANCSGIQLVLYGADSEIGIERSYLDSFLVGNIARWPEYSGATAYVLNNIVYVKDANGNQHFYRLSVASSTGNAPATGPFSNTNWVYVGSYMSAAPGSSAYSEGTTYGTIGTLVTFGGQTYYNTTSQGSAGHPPPGTTTAGARTSTALWQWVNNCLGTATSGQRPTYHIEFSMVQSYIQNVYPTCCPCSGIRLVGACSGSIVSYNVLNGYVPVRQNNAAEQLPGTDAEAIIVDSLTSSATTPSPSGLVRVDHNVITNAGQDGFGTHANGINIQDSRRVGCDDNMFIFDTWTGGPTVSTVQPYRLGQSAGTVDDIEITNTKVSTAGSSYSNGLSAYVTVTGTVTHVKADVPAPVAYTSGTNTIPVWGPPVYIAGGTNSLPKASSVRPDVPFYVANRTAEAVTLASAEGNINSGASLSIPTHSAVVCMSDGTNWWAT